MISPGFVSPHLRNTFLVKTHPQASLTPTQGTALGWEEEPSKTRGSDQRWSEGTAQPRGAQVCQHTTKHAGKIKSSLFQKPPLLQQRCFKFKGRKVSAQHLGLYYIIQTV